MEFVDGPPREVLAKKAEDNDELLRVRAWEVEESPRDLGYRIVKGWPTLPSGWKPGQVAGVAADSKGRYYVYHRGNEAPPLYLPEDRLDPASEGLLQIHCHTPRK